MAEPSFNYSRETCAFCGGSGKDLGPGQDNDPSQDVVAEDLKCKVCNGQGSVLVAQPSRQCSFCVGLGIARPPPPCLRASLLRFNCEVCGGTGWAGIPIQTAMRLLTIKTGLE